MAKKDLKDFSKEELEKKEKGYKTLIGISIPLIIGLLFFVIRDYVNGEEVEWAILTSVICTMSIPATVYPELKKVREEMSKRS